MNKRVTPSRYPSRSTTNAEQIQSVLDEARFCTVAYVKEGKAYQIPTGFTREGNDIIIHGSVKSNFLLQILENEEVSVSLMLFDGLVLSSTAFDHSVNYRSVVVFAKPRRLHDREQMKAVLTSFTEKYIPGRMEDLPEITPDELKATMVVALEVMESSLKMRTGGSGVVESDVWTGVIPASQVYGKPIPDSKVNLPDYIQKILKD